MVRLFFFFALTVCAWQVQGATLACKGAMESSPLCVELKRSLSTKSRVELLRIEIASIRQRPWEPMQQITADTTYETGVKLFVDEYYGDAAIYFEEAAIIYQGLIEEFDRLRSDTRRRAGEALSSREFLEAIQLYKELQQWQEKTEFDQAILSANQGIADEAIIRSAQEFVTQSNASAARELLAQLTTEWFSEEEALLLREISALDKDALHQVQIDAGNRALKTGDISEAARLFNEALRIKSNSQAAKNGLAAVRIALTNRQITLGYRSLDEGELEKAQAHFHQALKLSPDSQASKDGAEDVYDIGRKRDITTLKHLLEIAEMQEDWETSSMVIAKLLQYLPNDRQYILRQERYTSLNIYEEKLDFHIGNPSRYTSKNVRKDIATLLDRYQEIEDPGSRITNKHETLVSMFTQETVKVDIMLHSNGKTEVVITPGKSLGAFKQLTISAFPGSYRISGRRSGHREVVEKLVVTHDGGPYVVNIAADKKF
jgi:tetratricopeptide (TPR) repeat protein